MSLTTTRTDFDAALVESKMVSVCREIFADSDTPVNIYRKLSPGSEYSFLLESASQGGIFARYSFIGAASFGVLSERDGHATWQPAKGSVLSEERLLPGGVEKLKPVEALEKLNERWSSSQAGLPPLSNGFVGYLGWESVHELFDFHSNKTDGVLPRQMLSLVSELVVVDHKEGHLILVANVLNDGEESGDALWAAAAERLDALQQRLLEPMPTNLAIKTEVAPEINRSTPREKYLTSVENIKRRIANGEASQIVISQRFENTLTAEALDVYRVLRHNNPSPFLYLLDFMTPSGSALQVVGSSPEALITVTGGKVQTHPIAGSRPRGATLEEDVILERELLEDSKEVNEHKMLVDLAKEDLSKICEPETIEVSGYMRVERFSHVMHIVSTVSGNLQEGESAISAFRATFPAGTLSGAPKPYSLEVIDELEETTRGVYGGVVGYFSGNGDADLAIAIRTATIYQNSVHVQAGAGIVIDSDPAKEDQETINKASAPLRAVAVANNLKRLP